MAEVVRLSMSQIYPRLEGRAVVQARVAVLVDSIRAIGLQSPITVRACERIRDGRPTAAFEIVAGRHRYEAARSLHWDEIDAFLMEGDPEDIELWEIDENFARAELTDSQRATAHSRREEILVAKGIVTKPGRGGDRTSNRQNADSYADQAARSLGVHADTVRRDLRRGKKIAPEVMAAVVGTDLDRGVVLDELASTPKPEQGAKLVEIERRRSAVKLAPDPLNDPEAHEKQLAALMSAWNRAAAVVRQEFLLRVDGPVFDRTAASG